MIPNSLKIIEDYAFYMDAYENLLIVSIPQWLIDKGKDEWTRCGLSETAVNRYMMISAIREKGGYASAVEMKNGNTKYYKVSKGGRYGLTDSEGKEIVPCEMEALESAGTGYLKYKINGFWGVMNYAGKIIIDTDRGYTSIGNFLTFTKRFPYTMSGYKGECDATGRQISKIKIETPKQAVATQTTTTPKKQEGEQKIIIEHKHDPVPMQVWKQCQICFGSGTCQACANIIWPSGSDRKCMACGWSRKCQFCAGNGGHYEVEYK